MCNPTQSAAPIAPRPLLLYYITDRRQFPGTPAGQEQRLLLKITESALAGVDYIQLREKDLSTRELEQLATRAMAALPDGCRTRLLINSRIDVALACGAHGVNLPGNYLSPADARAIFAAAGKGDAVISVSTHSLAEVAVAESHGADFAVFGPVFEKSGTLNPTGLEQLATVCRRPQAASPAMPVLALGGVTLENAAQCVARGAAGIAAIRLFQESDIGQTVSKLRELRASTQVSGS